MDAAKEADNADSIDSQSPWALYMPKELLLSIFQYSVSTWGPVPFLCRACQVCPLWREVARDASLWRRLDLSSGWIRKNVLGLTSLRRSGRFQAVRSLNLTAWWHLLDHHLEVVLAACPILTHLNISHCQVLTDSGIRSLADMAPITLSHLDMTHMAPLATSIPSMRHLITKIGPQLQSLNISSNVFTHKFSNVLLIITLHCVGLKSLLMHDIHVAGGVKIPLDITAMQASIASLEELHIDGTPFIALNVHEEGPGFSSLQSYTAHTHNGNQDEEDQLFVERMLCNSCSLKTLNLRECLGTLNLQTLVCTDLRSFTLPNSVRWLEILPHLRRWQHSLVELDVSWCKGHWRMVEASFQKLLQPAISFPALNTINLSGTNITGRTLCFLLESCPRLRELILIGCRSLPTAWCRHFKNDSLGDFKRQAFGD